jgi:hypothetical protein
MVPPRLSTVRKRELSGPPTVSITRSTPLTTPAACVLVQSMNSSARSLCSNC